MEYFFFNFPIIVWILLCQMVFGALPKPHVPESRIHLGQTLPHIEEGAVSRKAPRTEAPRNLSLIVWARPWHFWPSGKLWTESPISVSYLFFFSFPKFKKNTFSFELYIYYYFKYVVQEEMYAWGLQRNSSGEELMSPLWYTLLFFVPWWCSVNSFRRNKSENFLLMYY